MSQCCIKPPDVLGEFRELRPRIRCVFRETDLRRNDGQRNSRDEIGPAPAVRRVSSVWPSPSHRHSPSFLRPMNEIPTGRATPTRASVTYARPVSLHADSAEIPCRRVLPGDFLMQHANPLSPVAVSRRANGVCRNSLRTKSSRHWPARRAFAHRLTRSKDFHRCVIAAGDETIFHSLFLIFDAAAELGENVPRERIRRPRMEERFTLRRDFCLLVLISRERGRNVMGLHSFVTYYWPTRRGFSQ